MQVLPYPKQHTTHQSERGPTPQVCSWLRQVTLPSPSIPSLASLECSTLITTMYEAFFSFLSLPPLLKFILMFFPSYLLFFQFLDNLTLPRWPGNAVPATGDDGHCDVVDEVTGILHSFWQLSLSNGRYF